MKPSALREAFCRLGKVPGCPIVDVHAHHGTYPGIYFPRSDGEAMTGTMRRCGVKLGFVSSHVALLDPALGNGITAELLAAYPEHFRGYWVIDPYEPRIPERFPAGNPNFVGFKLHPSLADYPLEGPGYAAALAYALARGCPSSPIHGATTRVAARRTCGASWNAIPGSPCCSAIAVLAHGMM